jgi:hypothetical protein
MRPPIAFIFLAAASHIIPTTARIAKGFDKRLWAVFDANVLPTAERAAQPVENRCAEAQPFDALRRPIGGNFIAAHPPHLFGVGLEEDREQPLTELVAHPIVKGFGIFDGEGFGQAKEAMQATLCRSPRLRSASNAFSGYE